MKTELRYLDATTGQPSDCGAVLEIEVSSRHLHWDGVLLEMGRSPSFYPTNVVTPDFYFALAHDIDFSMNIIRDGVERIVSTHPDEIWINAPFAPFTHEVNDPCAFTILTVESRLVYEALPDGAKYENVRFLTDYNIMDSTMTALIGLFLREAEQDGRSGPLFLGNLIRSFCAYFVAHYSDAVEISNGDAATADVGGLNDQEFGSVREFLDKNLGASFTVDALAEIVHMSKFHFLRKFKQRTGLTPHRYLVWLRIERAKMLLSRPDLTLQEIAYSLGFSDQSHFTRTFKAATGVSPGRFRVK